MQRSRIKRYPSNCYQLCLTPTGVTQHATISSSTKSWRTRTEVEIATLWIYKHRIRSETTRIGRARFGFYIVIKRVLYVSTINIETILTIISRTSNDTIGNAQVGSLTHSNHTQLWSFAIVHGNVIYHHLVLCTSSFAA